MILAVIHWVYFCYHYYYFVHVHVGQEPAGWNLPTFNDTAAAGSLMMMCWCAALCTAQANQATLNCLYEQIQFDSVQTAQVLLCSSSTGQ